VFRAVRDHYDGAKRNPWNEIECGSNYARSMASWGAVPTLSGFSYDAHDGTIGFAPKTRNGTGFGSFFSCGSAWGTARLVEGRFTIEVNEGSLALAGVDLAGLQADTAVTVTLDGSPIEHRVENGRIRFAPLEMRAGRTLGIQSASLSSAGLQDIATLQ